jgi:Ser/Thr protein kinase RdoA (MazF antagonist)
MLPEVETILSFFPVDGTLLRAGRYGSGLINDTFLCEFREDIVLRKYVLQRINASVFRQPEAVMANIEAVTSHVIGKLRSSGQADPERLFPSLVRTRSGSSFVRDGSGEFWRLFHFIDAGEVFDTVMDADHAFEVGRGLGMFQSLVVDLPPARLSDTLPGFHHTPRYLDEYDQSRRVDRVGRAREAEAEAAFVDRRRSLASILTGPLAAGEIPLRVVHNDPKVNNIMIDRATRKALCMLDLDTVKPGIVHFDFGDCVRSAANPLGEDAPDIEAVRIDLSLFRAVTRGYLQEAAAFLTKREIELLPASVRVITFELGLRFLADHLRGDTYFRANYPGHNLHRARVQFRLLESIEKHERQMTSLPALNRRP